jgi:Niemann-Pick C1 protein
MSLTPTDLPRFFTHRVDNVFILSHELDQQNARAYATASRHGPLFGMEAGEDDDPEGLPSAEERVARALGRMGPSILLSASCETVAFALGALVGSEFFF